MKMPEISHQRESHQPDSGGDEDIVTDRTTVWKSNETENEKEEREKKRERLVSHLYSLVRIGWSVLSLALSPQTFLWYEFHQPFHKWLCETCQSPKRKEEQIHVWIYSRGDVRAENRERTVHTLTGAHVGQMSHTTALLFCIYGAVLLKWI